MSSKFGDFVGGLFTVIFYIVILWGEFAGVYHSFKKHEDGWLSLFVPPVAWYHGFELFWHQDYSESEWKAKLKNDMETCTYFFVQFVDKDRNTYQLNQDAQEFSKQIMEYPEEKINFLKSGSKAYISYNIELFKDLSHAFDIQNSKPTITKSQKTLKHEKELIDVYQLDVLALVSDSLLNMLNSSLSQEKPEADFNRSAVKDKFNLILDIYTVSYSQTYEKLFREKPDL